MPVKKSNDELYSIWERFINDGELAAGINPEIAASWKRSKSFGVDPLGASPLPANKHSINDLRKKNRRLIEVVTPFIGLIEKFIQNTGFMLTLVDKDGYLLEIRGDSEEALKRAKVSMLVEGANRSEAKAGTNAIGLALTEDRPLQLVGPEHYKKCYHDWTCSSAPIHDTSGKILGILNLSGHRSLIHKHTLGMVTSLAQDIERELRIQEQNSALRLANEQLNAVIDSIAEGVIAVDQQGQIIEVNAKFQSLFKVSKAELQGKQIGDVFTSSSSLPEILETGKEYFDREKELSRASLQVSAMVTGRKILNDKGEIVGAVEIIKEKKDVYRLVNKLTGAKAVFTFDNIVHEDAQMANIIDMGRSVAETDTRVLLEAESGTGKELFAQAIHNASPRRKGPFVAVNCSAIPRELIESELFGYSEGAFTGAKKGGKPGKFELAEGGTLFLDEVNSMPLDMQVKLLRVLQQNEVTRLGGEQAVPLNVRIIAASNRSLEELVQEGHFRLDLFYRLGVVVIKIPPLRERIKDIPVLFKHLLQKISRSIGKPLTYCEDEILPALCAYAWPGNVREMENYIERAVVLARDGTLTIHQFPEKLHPKGNHSDEVNLNYLAIKERESIIKVLEMYNGNISKAAKNLGISRNTIYSKIKAYGISPT